MDLRRISLATAIALAGVSLSAPVFAGVVLVDDLREVFTLGTADDGSSSQSWSESDFPTLHADFFSGVIGEGDTGAAYGNGSAFQDSAVSADQFSGNGYTDGFAALSSSASGSVDTFSQSVFDVGFDVLSAHNYTLEGSIYAADGAVDYAAVGILNLNTFQLVEEFATDVDGNISFVAAGILDPGFYAMIAFAETAIFITDGWDSGEAYWEFDLRLTAIPLPGALWLFGGALMFLLRRR